MAMHAFIVVRRDVAARKVLFNPRQELRIDSHQIFALTVDRAILHHPDLPVALDDLSLDLSRLLVDEIGPVFLAVEDGVARLSNAVGTKRVRCARPAKSRLRLLPGFQQRLVGPFWSKRRIRIVLVEVLD